jgi:hypothetical protein
MTLPAMPSRDSTLTYPGGGLAGTRALLSLIFKDFENAACAATVQDRTRQEHTRTAYIGAEPTKVAASEWTHKKFLRR